MSIFDGRRLPVRVFKLDVERMRAGWYSDKYFENIVALLADLARLGYRFGGTKPDLSDLHLDLSNIDTGNLEVEMQWFTRRQPVTIVAGVDKALAMLKECTGYFEASDRFINTAGRLQVWAVHDGVKLPYNGDPLQVLPAMRVHGRYRDFALLETPTLGALTRGSRIATNVYQVLVAARGKPVLFFPARFDAHEIQAADGYAYRIAVERFNRDFRQNVGSFISTDAQGDWWGARGAGTVAHALIACFLGDTAEAMMAFAATRPPEIPRIALIDFQNDCVGTTRQVMRRMFAKFLELTLSGQPEEAKRYRLYGVRPDTAGNMRDISVAPLGDPKLDCGVNPRLVFALRQAIDDAYTDWDLPPEHRELARRWCRNVKIVVTGGFTPEKISEFEYLKVPADVYGVGSWLLSSCAEHHTANDFTADVVRVKIDGRWIDMAKVGRQACDNPELEEVALEELG